MKEGAVKAVIFDIGGVLSLGAKTRFHRKEIHTSGIHQMVATKLNISLDQYFDSIDTYYAKSIEGQITRKRLLKVMSLNLNYPEKKLEYLFHKGYRKIFRRNNELYSIARKIKKAGYKVAILSDQWHLSKDIVMPKKDMDLFDEVVASCDVGMRKPNPEIYKLILKKLKLKPEETIFIDNQSWNIVPAHKLGINTILFQNNKKTLDQLKKFGVKL